MLKSKSHYIDYLIIAIVVIIGYWQVSFYQYTIKCDASLLSLPWKKFVSDSLRSGYFPIWNPYINLGWTQGMEPSSWYYPSWVFALFGKYRLSYLHTEIVLHFILGGVGMYKLLSLLKLDRWALISGSLVYILSGFFVGNFQHLGWTFYGCWFPVVLFYFFSLMKQPGWITALKFGLTGAMLVLSSYIPFIMTTLIFLVLAICFVVVRNFRQKKNTETFKFIKFTFVSILVLFIICAPAFYMLYINSDTMVRGGRYDDKTAGFGSLVPMSYTSLVLPFGTVAKAKLWEGTDISMNNVFIGMISFLLIGFAFVGREKKKLVWLVSGIGLLALLFAFGSYIPPTFWIFRHLPFYEKLRFASQFRIYFIVAACILIAIGSNYLLKKEGSKKIKIFLIANTLIWLGYGLSRDPSVFLNQFHTIFVKGEGNYSVFQAMKFQGLIWGILFLILTIWYFITRKNQKCVAKKLIIFNILFFIIAAQMNMFFTAVANEKVSVINKQWLQLPDKFHPIQNKSYKNYWHAGVGQTWTNVGTLYQEPNINCYHPYDSKNYGDYMNFKVFDAQNLPIVFSRDEAWGSEGLVSIFAYSKTDFIDFNPYRMKFTTNTTTPTVVLVQMSPTPSTTVTVNENPQTFNTANSMIALDSVPQDSNVVISFLPKYAIGFAWFGIIGLMAILVILILNRIKYNTLPGV